MADQVVEKHQLAGLDERERGFNRPVDIQQGPDGWRASLRYEATVISSAPSAAQADALPSLVARLQQRGYRQLKTQLSFQSGTYQGSRHEWVEYPDPEEPAADAGWLSRLWQGFRRRFGSSAEPADHVSKVRLPRE